MTAWKEPCIVDRPVLVLGGRIMGRRIACLWLAGGFDVNILDNDSLERADAMQYVNNHVKEYIERIGSTKRGVFTTWKGLEAANARNPWLLIEAWPTVHPLLGHTNPGVDLSACLNESLPQDCVLCMNSLVPSSRTFLKNMVRPHRVLGLHHYLIPNARVIEISPDVHTDVAVVKFLATMIECIGSLPVISKYDEPALAFKPTWLYFRQEILDVLYDNASSGAVDHTWEALLRKTSAEELELWFLDLSKQFGAFIQSRYMTTRHQGQPVLHQLKDIFSKAAEVPPSITCNSLGLRLPSDGLATKVSTTLYRRGVLGNLQDTKWLRVDPRAGHVYTTNFLGVLARCDMITGKNG